MMFVCEYPGPKKSICQLTSEELEFFESRLHPKKSSRVGFLGIDDTLIDTYTKDKKYLESRNVTAKQIADRIESILKEAYTTRNSIVKDKLKVNYSISTCGHQQCPFHELDNDVDNIIGNCDPIIINVDTKEELKLPILITHLARTRGFFEGEGSPYRVDPEKAIRVLEIEPGVDYSLKLTTIKEWKWYGYNSSLSGTVEKCEPY